MRQAQLVRIEQTDEGTIGRLTAGDLACFVMEPPWRDNRRNLSCIPAGRYLVQPHRSPRFGRCLLVPEVPDRTHILVHAGNVGGDVEGGWHTHTLGCLLPGLRRGRLPVKGRMQRAVLSSRTALRHLMAYAGDGPFELVISDA